MIKSIPGMDAVIVGNDQITDKVLSVADKLKVISKHGVGVDNIDLAAAKEKGVIVTNTPGANTEAVAELTVGLIFALVRKIVDAHLSTRSGEWKRFVGVEIQGKTVGVIGLGRIGKEVAKKLIGLGAKVVAFDIVKNWAFAKKFKIKYLELSELLRNSDIITLHLPLTSQTENLLNEERLKLMKKGSFLVNTARGKLIDEESLAMALKSGRLAGAAVDVYGKEPSKKSILLKTDKCITLPHIGAYSSEALERMGMMTAENVVAVIYGKKPHNIVEAK